jgi:hypothetical protein
MPAPKLEGQFDDAPIDKLPEDSRQQYNRSDDTSPEHSDDISEGDDDFDSEELDNDFARVEDEDWEITERGGCSNPTLQNYSFLIPHHIRLYQTIQSPATASCRELWECAGCGFCDQANDISCLSPGRQPSKSSDACQVASVGSIARPRQVLVAFI